MKKTLPLNKGMNKQIIEEAAYWVTCLEDAALTAAENAEFSAWLRLSPHHIKEFLLAQAISTDATAIDPEAKISVEEILENIGADVIMLEPSGPSAQPSISFWSRLSGFQKIAASLFLAAALFTVGVLNPFSDNEEIYATMVGEQRSFLLTDGSVVHLNTGTKIKVRYEEGIRAIDLLVGEALFDVAPDLNRPFRVFAGGTVAQALGTSFNVYLKSEATEVAVLEGKVSINQDKAYLEMGDKISVTNAGKLQLSKVDDLKKIAPWRMRQLIFEDTPLTEIIYEFNRYNLRQIKVENNGGKILKFSGVFNVNKPRSFLDTLKISGLAKITYKIDNTIIVRLNNNS